MATIEGLQHQIAVHTLHNRNESPEWLAKVNLLSECGTAIHGLQYQVNFWTDRCGQMEAALTELEREPHGQAAVMDITRRGLAEPKDKEALKMCAIPHACKYKALVEAMAKTIEQIDPPVKAIRDWYFAVAQQDAQRKANP